MSSCLYLVEEKAGTQRQSHNINSEPVLSTTKLCVQTTELLKTENQVTDTNRVNWGVSIKTTVLLITARAGQLLLIWNGNLAASFRVDTSVTRDKLFINMERTGRVTLYQAHEKVVETFALDFRRIWQKFIEPQQTCLNTKLTWYVCNLFDNSEANKKDPWANMEKDSIVNARDVFASQSPGSHLRAQWLWFWIQLWHCPPPAVQNHKAVNRKVIYEAQEQEQKNSKTPWVWWSPQS